jgi:hypothetical protein
LNIFRLPLNAVVVAGTYATDVPPTYQVYMIVSACFMGAAVLHFTMIFPSSVGATDGGARRRKLEYSIQYIL